MSCLQVRSGWIQGNSPVEKTHRNCLTKYNFTLHKKLLQSYYSIWVLKHEMRIWLFVPYLILRWYEDIVLLELVYCRVFGGNCTLDGVLQGRSLEFLDLSKKSIHCKTFLLAFQTNKQPQNTSKTEQNRDTVYLFGHCC